MGKFEDRVISTLEGCDEGLTLAEIAERIGESEKKVFKALRKMFQKGIIDSKKHRYTLSDR